MTRVSLPPAVQGERLEIRRRNGQFSYYVAGRGKPMLLLHSINAAASVYEVQPVYEHALRSHRVYAPDLPGYGFSERSSRPYEINLFCDAIRDMLDVIAQEHGKAPVDALGLSLSAEFLARVAEGHQPRNSRCVFDRDVSSVARRAVRRPREPREQPELSCRRWDEFLSRS